jgi:hypothetical protein
MFRTLGEVVNDLESIVRAWLQVVNDLAPSSEDALQVVDDLGGIFRTCPKVVDDLKRRSEHAARSLTTSPDVRNLPEGR